MAHWEVFGRRTWDDPWTAVGRVHAPDVELALLLARESFFRHREGVELAVVRAADFHPMPPGFMDEGTDKSYRLQSGYTGLGRKRRRAAASAEAAGARIDRPRPSDQRAFNPRHLDEDEA